MTGLVDISCENNSIKKSKTILTLILYCTSGTLLTLINKFAVVIFPYTNMLLVLQNSIAVLLFVVASQFCRQALGSLPSLSLTVLQLWMPLVLLFVMMLTSSLLALAYVSVPTVIVMRNLTTLFVAILDYILLRNKINGFSTATLIFILFGATLYARHDLTFSIPGYIWLFVNIISTSAYQIYIKKIIDLPIFEHIGSIGMSYYNNLISLPLLFILSCIMGELKALPSTLDLKYLLEIKTIGLISLSGILGFLLSISAFALNKQISATSMMVANNANKFSIIVLSEICIQSTLDIMASLGAISVLFFGWLYSQTAKPLSKTLFVMVGIILTVTVAVLEHKHYITNSMLHINHLLQRDFIIRNTSVLNKSFTVKNQIITDMEKRKGDEIYRSYIPTYKLFEGSRRIAPGILVKNTTEFQLPKVCINKNSSIWKICNATRCIPYTGKLNWDYPRTTNLGENTGEFINRVLEIAWGSNPPSVDLYLRSGCNGIMEMRYLFESIEIFWPRFLGSIIIVLDAGDQMILKDLVPVKPTHRYVIAFEHTPCLPGRVFNQYSYLNLDQHSSADYVVTIDSDCIFHSPVTPDLVFRQGRVILASSRTFQKGAWDKPLDGMMGVGMYDGHYMVTQPITFSVSTFSSFRRWFHESKEKCYEDQLSQLSPDNYGMFCWMCQLGTYLEKGNPERTEYNKYWYQHLDDSTIEPILRYAIHVTYEHYNSTGCEEAKCYEKSANEAIRQGLCRAFGSSIFRFCKNYPNMDYIDKVTLSYAHQEIQAAGLNARASAVIRYLERLNKVTMIALNGSTEI